MIPASGSAYTYAYATVGEIFAWIIGWDLVLEYGMGAATVAVGWSGYAISLLDSFGIHVAPQWASATGEVITLPDGTSVTGILNLPAVLVVVALDPSPHARHARILAASITSWWHSSCSSLPSSSSWGLLCAQRLLDAVHAGKYRHVWPVRLERRPPRIFRRVLCLYRLRCSFDCGAGGTPATKGHAGHHQCEQHIQDGADDQRAEDADRHVLLRILASCAASRPRRSRYRRRRSRRPPRRTPLQPNGRTRRCWAE